LAATPTTQPVLSVASLAIPTLAAAPGGPDFGHAPFVSVVTSVVRIVTLRALS
jgi:hypothetical protein